MLMNVGPITDLWECDDLLSKKVDTILYNFEENFSFNCHETSIVLSPVGYLEDIQHVLKLKVKTTIEDIVQKEKEDIKKHEGKITLIQDKEEQLNEMFRLKDQTIIDTLNSIRNYMHKTVREIVVELELRDNLSRRDYPHLNDLIQKMRRDLTE